MNKNIYLATLALASLSLASCEPTSVSEVFPSDSHKSLVHLSFDVPDITVTPPSTRATLTANDRALTDLHIIDYVSGVPVAVLHQTSTATDFAEPTLSLPYGSHHLVAYATRSTAPGIYTATGAIPLTPNLFTDLTTTPTLWGASKISDSFLGTADLNIQAGSSATCTISLSRIVSQVSMTIADEIPADASKILLSFTHYGDRANLATGASTLTTAVREIDLSSARGNTGQKLSVFSLTPDAQQYYTDISVSVISTSDKVLTAFDLQDVPLQRSRTTTISGTFFTHGNGMTFTIDDTWGENIEYNF